MGPLFPLAFLCVFQLFFGESSLENPSRPGTSKVLLPLDRSMITGTDEENDPTRSCYVCDYELDGEACKTTNKTLLRASECPQKEDVCKVWHFYSATDQSDTRTYYFERGCTDKCQPGCTSLDDMEHRFVSCFSCCTGDLCNVDSHAVIHINIPYTLWAPVITFLYTCLNM